MQRSTATRRLVKSSPELWAELSSEDSLGRHLARFGEIRITRVSAETTVAWEGDRVSGTVELEPTGWGTKVSLSATPHAAPERAPAHVVAKTAPAVAETVVARAAPAVAETVVARAAPEPAPLPALPEPAAPVAAEPTPAPEKRRGFFARLLRRRHRTARTPQPAAVIPGTPLPMPDPSPPTPVPDPSPPAPGQDPSPPDPGPAPTPSAPRPEPGPPSPIPPPPAPQIRVAPPAAPAQPVLDPSSAVAILTAVLDDLGAAHHRPFSRD